ncbi:MAG: hemolysin family protein [Lachnospiraceae bacterium]|nr:hemolysin family protein [Lachnospiraceae bacterium]
MDLFFSIINTWWFNVLLMVILCAFELMFSVCLSLVEDINESDIEEVKDSFNEIKFKKLTKFISNKRMYESRFHAALITVNIIMLAPLYQILRLSKAYIPDSVMLIFIIGSFFALIIFLFLNYLFCFSLPRKLIIHSSSMNKAKLTLGSLKYSVLMIPFADFSDRLLEIFFKVIGKDHYNNEEEVTEDDILSMVQESQDQGILEADEAEMINNIFELNDLEASDIMTNRNSIVAINGDMTLSEVIKIMLDGSNSRYPVYLDNLDHIIGILNLKDALRFQNSNKNKNGAIKRYPQLFREARFVSETRKVDDLFHKMQADKLQMVIVIDEYGQTSGLLTMEDILEEIVGNILDEYDEEETFFEKKGEMTYEIDGLTPLEDLSTLLHKDFENDDFDTINGLLTDKLGHIPGENDTDPLIINGFSFEIMQVENHVIKTVLVKQAENVNDSSDSVTDISEAQDVERTTN